MARRIEADGQHPSKYRIYAFEHRIKKLNKAERAKAREQTPEDN